jgi:hypothetical protein
MSKRNIGHNMLDGTYEIKAHKVGNKIYRLVHERTEPLLPRQRARDLHELLGSQQ